MKHMPASLLAAARRFANVQGERRSGLRAEHDVLADGHRVHQHEVLVDHPNTDGDRIVWRRQAAHLAIDDDIAAVR